MDSIQVLITFCFIGLDAMYARSLIAGWIYMWTKKDPNYTIDLLSFSDPNSWYNNEPEPLTYKNVNLHDYYSVDVDKIARKDSENLEYILKIAKFKFKNAVIIDCLSSLVLYAGLSKALWFLEKLSTEVSQLICIYRRDFMPNKVPSIETLGTTYVKLDKFSSISSINNLTYNVKLVHRKAGGSIIHQIEVINQNNVSYEINAEKVNIQNNRKMDQVHTNPAVKIESSFRIEKSAYEKEQKSKTPLPYTLNATNTSKIHYQPDDADDIDEDDPDEDLCF